MSPQPYVHGPFGSGTQGFQWQLANIVSRGQLVSALLFSVGINPATLGAGPKVSLEAIKELIKKSKLLKSSKEAIQLGRQGGKTEAQRTFDSLTVNAEVKSRPSPSGTEVRSAQIEGGGSVSVRDFSKGGQPTIQIERPGETTVKIRF